MYVDHQTGEGEMYKKTVKVSRKRNITPSVGSSNYKVKMFSVGRI